MKLFSFSLIVALGQAADLLFLSTLIGAELDLATNELGLTATVQDPTTWASLDEDYFKSFKAIIVGDPNSVNERLLDPIIRSRDAWSPAIKGNVIVIGSDPADPNHRPLGGNQLILNSIRFAMSGSGTGLYLALSQYYEDVRGTEPLQVLENLGKFTIRGVPDNCEDKAHIVATHSALNLLTDEKLSNWRCSIHEGFPTYPSSFHALAIASNVTDEGAKKFPDGSVGLPYIIATNITSLFCQNCIPYPGQNLCHPTTSCTPTPFGTMCLTRPGYKADGIANDDLTKQWRLEWPVGGHEHRVAVAPGVVSDTLCETQKGSAHAVLCGEVKLADCSATSSSTGSRHAELQNDNGQKVMAQLKL